MRQLQVSVFSLICFVCVASLMAFQGGKPAPPISGDRIYVLSGIGATESITLNSTVKEGTFIAMHETDKATLRIAITTKGLQVVDNAGKIRFISLQELAALDKGSQ